MHSENTNETLPLKYLKHSKQYYCNMTLKRLQHMQQVQHPPIYFCNIRMIQLQHVSEAIETIET
jgi:hypothetical protein